MRRDDREGTTDVTSRRNHEITKVVLFESDERKGKETVHLVGNRKSWWDDRVGTDVTGGPDCCRCPRLTRKGATITVAPT